MCTFVVHVNKADKKAGKKAGNTRSVASACARQTTGRGRFLKLRVNFRLLRNMETEDERQSHTMMPIDSGEVEERLQPGSDAQTLGQTLRREVNAGEHHDPDSIAAPWRRFFAPDETADQLKTPETDLIASESTKLREKWMVFRANQPMEERLSLQKSEPTIQGCIDVVTEVTESWCVRSENGWRGKVSKVLRSFGRTLYAHKALLQILPEGNEYVPIFAGSLNAVIKACENHEKIATGLSDSLWAISEYIVECKVDHELFQAREMRDLVVDLYAHVFVFLNSTMDWIMEKRRKRLLDSFNESFNKRFDDEVMLIKHKASRIHHLAAQSSWAELRATRLALENMGRDTRLGLVAGDRQFAELQYRLKAIERRIEEGNRYREQTPQLWQHLGSRTKTQLQDGVIGWLDASRDAAHPTPMSFVLEAPESCSMLPTKLAMDLTAGDIALNSRGLEDFFSRDRIRLPYEMSEPLPANDELILQLEAWTRVDKSSRTLWIEGPVIQAEEVDNPITMVAAKFLELADSSGTRSLSYFCHLSRYDQLLPGNPTIEAQSLVSVVYALLRQMIELVPPGFRADADLSQARFQHLDGTIATWGEAMALLGDLAALLPVDSLCVLDGLHWLDDTSTDTQLNELVGLLMLRAEKLRILFTTTGRSGALRRAISITNTIIVDSLYHHNLRQQVTSPKSISVFGREQ